MSNAYNRMSARKKPLPPDLELYEEAVRLYEYRPDGTLVFRVDPRHRHCTTSAFIGKKVGGNDGHGYLGCLLLGHKFKVHQIVWLMHHGVFPPKPIDHINRDRRDNRIENLRLADDLQNMQNLTASEQPTAGTWRSPRSGRYCARLTYKNQKVYLGYFDTQEQANAAYQEAKRKLASEFSPV